MERGKGGGGVGEGWSGGGVDHKCTSIFILITDQYTGIDTLMIMEGRENKIHSV